MENNEIQIKCYDYFDQYAVILFCLLWGGILVVFFILDITKWILGIAICVPFILLGIVVIVILRVKCNTYDIYSSKGIRRIMKDKEVFNIEWDEIETLDYNSFWGFIILQPFVLSLYLKQPPKMEKIVYWNGDNTKSISTPMSKRTLKKLAQFIPPHLLEDLKLKPSKQTPQNTDKQ